MNALSVYMPGTGGVVLCWCWVVGSCWVVWYVCGPRASTRPYTLARRGGVHRFFCASVAGLLPFLLPFTRLSTFNPSIYAVCRFLN